jgi:hypothetical protein
MKKLKEKMPPSKKIVKKGGKQVAGIKYSQEKEEYDNKIGDEDNFPSRKPADISGALMRAKEGYSKKPRVKPDKMKGKGKK